MAFLIQMFVLVDPIVPLIFFAVAFVASIMWWIARNKVKKIEKEIAEIKKEQSNGIDNSRWGTWEDV